MGQHETYNICIIGIPGEEREQKIESLVAEMTENLPNSVRERLTHVQEAQRIPIRMNTKRPTSRHITIKMAVFKDKGRILKALREKC